MTAAPPAPNAERRGFPQFTARLFEKRIRIIALILFLAAWQTAVVLFEIPSYLLPAPSKIIVEVYKSRKLIGIYTLVTALETFLGFFAAVLIGVALSIFVAFNRVIRKTIYPMTVAMQLVPKIALAPLFITWFGFGILPKIIIVFLLCIFPILLNGILGFLSINRELEWFAYSTGAGKMRVFRKIRLQHALPQTFVGIRWAAVNATVGATIGEWIGGDAGLGYYMQIAAGDLRMNLAFAIILVLAALGMLLFKAVEFAESRMIPWHASQRREKNGKFV